MQISAVSLAIVGADYPNKSGPTRRFEIALCAPGDAVKLVPEPKNPADEHAIMVMSERDVLMGYVPSQRAPYIKGLMKAKHKIRAIFQAKADFGAWIRVAFDGEEPTLPPQRPSPESFGDPDSGFYPDEVYPDD